MQFLEILIFFFNFAQCFAAFCILVEVISAAERSDVR